MKYNLSINGVYSRITEVVRIIASIKKRLVAQITLSMNANPD